MINLNGVLKGKLRACQSEAIAKADKFLGNKDDGGSCLICLPTGAGKTGVIASIAQFYRGNRVLILTHRSAVRNQIYAEVSGEFFKRVVPGEKIDLKPVFHLKDSAEKDGIYVSTFQKFTMIGDDFFSKLKGTFDVIIVDEGHSEPAPVWSKVSRGLKGKRIIVTATPYRNDLFQFDISSDYGYLYSFQNAISAGVLREPTFEQAEEKDIGLKIKTYLDAQKGTKCIVKCRSYEEVERYAGLLRKDFTCLSVHSRYSGKEAGSVNKVPPRSELTGIQVLIHENIIDEGVDIPEAKILVATYPISNGRELVQSIGRIVRVHGETVPHVIDMSSESNFRMWNNYREFDAYLSDKEAWRKFLRSLDTASLISSYLGAFPDYSYFGSSFKRKFNLNEFDPAAAILVPLASMCFVKKKSKFSIESFCDTLYWRSTRNGELVKLFKNIFGFDVVLSVTFNNSKFLKEELFFEPSLEVTLIKDLGEMVAIYDSRACDFSNEDEFLLGNSVDTEKLLALSARTNVRRTKETHAAAVSSSSNRPDGFSMKGVDLERIPPSQGNGNFAIRRICVDNLNDGGQRDSSYYIGMRAGRVADRKKRNFSISELSDWVDDIYSVLSAGGAIKSELLDSFAKPVNELPAGEPASVLIDLMGLDANISLDIGGVNHEVGPDMYFSPYNGGLEIRAQPQPIRLKLQLDVDSERLVYSSDHQIRCISPIPQVGLGEDFLGWLDKRPLKVLYPGRLSYLDGKFYKASFSTEAGIDLDNKKIGGRIFGLQELSGPDLDEKGLGNAALDSFCRDSLFYLVDQLKAISHSNLMSDYGPFFKHIPDCDFVLCTDMGTEPCDFIVSSPQRICFVHMKCGRAQNPMSSAGAIAEVGGQAIKNMEMLASRAEANIPDNWRRMPQRWPSEGSARYVEERLRLFSGKRAADYMLEHNISREDMYGKVLETLIRRRSSAVVEKEVWIVVGNGFSKSHFLETLKEGARAEAESLQAYQLFESWTSTASSNDVVFKAFVSV